MEDETDQQIIQNGFEALQLSFVAYFPGDEHGYALTVLKNSSSADVSLLQPRQTSSARLDALARQAKSG